MERLVFVAIVASLSLAGCCTALRCMNCFSSASFDDCDVTGYIEECRPNQKSCETVVRRYKGRLWITKGCKNTVACNNNQLQNFRWSGKSNQCNLDQRSSLCTCCCSGRSLCNAGRPECVDFFKDTNQMSCEPGTRKFPHGKVKCYNSGKVCRYECTEEDYVFWPAGRYTNVCRENGTWAYETPCCARPCPPYYLSDDLKLIHFERENAERRLHNFFDTFVYGVISEEALKHAVMYFNEEPVLSSLVRFDDYGENATLYMELVRERVKINNTGGGAKLGKAIRYSLDNIFTRQAGMRYEKVPKAIGIMINVNPDDDAVAAAEMARQRGYQVYVVGLELDGDFKFDRETLAKITGDPNLVYIFDQDYGETFQHHHFDGMDFGTCPNPCEHVMHSHD